MAYFYPYKEKICCVNVLTSTCTSFLLRNNHTSFKDNVSCFIFFVTPIHVCLRHINWDHWLFLHAFLKMLRKKNKCKTSFPPKYVELVYDIPQTLRENHSNIFLLCMVLLIIIILGTVFVHLFSLKGRNLFLAFDSSNIKRTLIRKRWSLSWEHKSSYFSFVLISVRIDNKKMNYKV